MNEIEFNIHQHKHEKHAIEFSQYTRQLIYGGLDGIITTFSIVAASVGANLDFKIVIIMGFANLFADAISMGFGEYISSSMERKLIMTEQERELYEIDNNLVEEKTEMVHLLTEKNMDYDDAVTIIDTFTSKAEYKDVFLNYMMFLEHNMLEPDTTVQLMKNGIVTFLSFLFFGSLPLIVFICICSINIELYTLAFWISTIVAVITMYFLGFVQALIASQNPLISGLIVMSNGIIATSCAYGIGYAFEQTL